MVLSERISSTEFMSFPFICLLSEKEKKISHFLVDHFLKIFSRQMKKELKGLTPMAMQKLMLYDWPGNVRELENTIEYAVAMTQQDVITEDPDPPYKGYCPGTIKAP